jgi:hypothetical protein
MSLFDNEENNITPKGKIIKGVLVEQEDKSNEELADEVSLVTDAEKQQEQEKQAKELQDKIAKTNDLFNPINYVSPVGPSSDKLTDTDYYPTKGRGLQQGSFQGKFLQTNFYAAQNLTPVGVIEARRKEAEAKAYAKAKNEELARQKVLSFHAEAAPQFVSELNDYAMMHIDKYVKKYNNNYQAILRDPEFIRDMRKFDEQGKATIMIHDRIKKLQTEAAKSTKTTSPEQVKIMEEYESASGNFNAEAVAKGILDGSLKVTDYQGRFDAYDTMETFHNTKKLDEFIVKVSEEKFAKAPKGTYSKLLQIGKTEQYLDPKAFKSGLARFVMDNKIYGAGNPVAPVGSEDFKQWEDFSEKQLQTAISYKRESITDRELKESGEHERFQDNLNASKFTYQKEKDNKNYYEEVRNQVTDEEGIQQIATISNPNKRREAYNEYMRQFPTNKNNGYTSIQLGEPTNSSGTWNKSQIFRSFENKNKPIKNKNGEVVGYETFVMTPNQIVEKSKVDAIFKKTYEGVISEAENILKNSSGDFHITSESASHSVRSSMGKIIPLELAGEGAHKQVFTTITQSGSIVVGYETNEQTKETEPILSSSGWNIMKPIDQAHERSVLLNRKPTSKQVETAQEY